MGATLCVRTEDEGARDVGQAVEVFLQPPAQSPRLHRDRAQLLEERKVRIGRVQREVAHLARKDDSRAPQLRELFGDRLRRQPSTPGDLAPVQLHTLLGEEQSDHRFTRAPEEGGSGTYSSVSHKPPSVSQWRTSVKPRLPMGNALIAS